MPFDTDSTIRQIEFELEKADRGMAMPYDAARRAVAQDVGRGAQAEAVGGAGEAAKIICPARGLTRMPLSPEQEALCERVEKGEPEPSAAALIRQQAHEIDDLWDRLSHAYALVRRETPAEMIQEEMEATSGG
jgi:hypothetical protein